MSLRDGMGPDDDGMRWGHPNGNHDPYSIIGPTYSCGCLVAILIFSTILAAVVTGIIVHATHTPLPPIHLW